MSPNIGLAGRPPLAPPWCSANAPFSRPERLIIDYRGWFSGQKQYPENFPRRPIRAARSGRLMNTGLVNAGFGPHWRNGMAQMVVVYKTPSDVEAFDRHYFGVHVALAKKLPGLRKYEVSAGSITMLGSAADTHFVAVLHFDSLAAIRSAFASPEGQACAADRRKLATDEGFQTFLFDSNEV
jgi:uncharacterized protein (TIGR02118 family)